MIKRFLRWALKKAHLQVINRKTSVIKEVKYKIGNIKNNNSHIDTLIPQFVEIGDNFVSAPGSIILAHDASLFKHTGYYRIEKTKIGNDVFLGANAVVLPGISIGDGAIIGAGAIVTKDVLSNTVVAGNPAKFICTVQEYIQKCQQKQCLYNAPASFEKYWKNERLSNDDIQEFQLSVLKQYEQRTTGASL